MPTGEKRTLLKATPALWLGSSVNPIIEYVTTLIVGITLGPLAAGAYFAADRLAKLLAAGLVTIEQVAAPELSRAWHRSDRTTTERIARLASIIAFAIAVIGALFYVALGPFILAVFDPGFAKAYPVLLILALGQAIHALCGANATLLTMAGAQRDLLVIRLVWSALTILFALIGAVSFGIIGAAIASAFSLAGWNLNAVLVCRAKLGIWTIFFHGSSGPVRALRGRA